MPGKKAITRARQAANEGKAPSTQASEFVREEIEEIREGKHGARSTKQAVAIGLSKARRAGVKLPPPKKGTVPEETRLKAQREYSAAHLGAKTSPSPKRARATIQALKRETRGAVSRKALSQQTQSAARRRSAADKSLAAKKAARTRARINQKHSRASAKGL